MHLDADDILPQCFNVAASIKMRKSDAYSVHEIGVYTELQCGRIYKDAEIRSWTSSGTFPTMWLQCGRIYKDAEMFLTREFT